MTEPMFDRMRHLMVASQLRTSAVNDVRVLDAMGKVPRERFVPADRASLAYIDGPVPLGGGRALNSPLATGRLLTELAPVSGERALVIGGASGYAAALLAEIGLDVVALEDTSELIATARVALAGDARVRVVEGPLEAGWPAGAPYDVILLDGAIEELPDALVAQLREGGRLGTGIIERGIARLGVGRHAGGGFGFSTVADVDAARLPGFARPRAFVF